MICILNQALSHSKLDLKRRQWLLQTWPQFEVIFITSVDKQIAILQTNWGDFVQGNFVHPILSFQFRAGKFRAHNEITCTGNFVHGNYVHEMKLRA